jgi:inorganic triphosphatase YgiF
VTDPLDQVEVELKLTATDAALSDLAARERVGPAVLGPTRTGQELDRYLDTRDGRLAAVSWACRLRTRGERSIVSLKGPAEPPRADGFHRRPEVEGPATPIPDPAAWPPSAARDRLETLTGGMPLVERFALRQDRAERDAVIGAACVATLSLDRVRVVHEGREVGRFASVELELMPGIGATPWLAELRAALVAEIGLQLDPLSKLEHAVALLEHAPA